MSNYPLILCGDQLEFEQRHANTPPEDRPDWPLPSFDAQDWAKAFCRIAKKLGHDKIDEDWMVTWFANALMRGFDEQTARLEPVIADLLAALKMAAELIQHANRGAFDNGVTDSTGSTDEGDVIAGNILDDIRTAIAKAEGR